jgi:SNF2 family DNA or RNA helicase
MSNIFTQNNNSKVLVFSEYTHIYNDITNILSNNRISHSTIRGHSGSINNTIERFKSDKSNKLDVLLLNSKFCGSGLNMENATDVIIYHKMSEELEKQVIGRAQRPGRNGKLNIWKLLYENEIQ